MCLVIGSLNCTNKKKKKRTKKEKMKMAFGNDLATHIPVTHTLQQVSTASNCLLKIISANFNQSLVETQTCKLN